MGTVLNPSLLQPKSNAGTYQVSPYGLQVHTGPATVQWGNGNKQPHVEQRLSQMQQVAPFLGHNFELLLERQGLTNPAAAYKVVSQAFNQHAQAAGVTPRTLLMQLLAQKRSQNPKLDGKYPA